MTKKSQWIWYLTNDDVRTAFLFNCRKRDLWDGPGINKGMIVEGTNGFVSAEGVVPKVTGKAVAFRANRRCEWQGLKLPCMAKAAAPTGQPVPRDFNYIVAELPALEAQQLATRLGLPVLRTTDGRALVNLEISRFNNQDKNRRATLL